jgi:FtsP/CotA-like multicopper oxidase with cupredoxin domain
VEVLDRRGFLVLSAVGAAAACSRSGRPAATPTMSASPNALDVALTPGPTQIDLGGMTVSTWAYDGRVPGKEIRLRKGETLRAVVTNNLPADTSVHWHGLAIPNPMDGVPVLTQAATAPGQRFNYVFAVPDSGTYWFHSHEGTQTDRGLFGPLIIEDPNERANYDDELVLVLDDWIDGTGTNPDQVLEKLKKNGMASMSPMAPDAGVTPTTPLGDDGGDVTYPYFVINGRVRTDPQTVDYRAGQRIRLRIINAGGDTAFRVGVPNTKMTVTHTDGFPVVPRETDSVILGMGERVDATIAVNSSVPVIAAAYGKDGFAQLNIRVNGAPSGVEIDQYVAALNISAPLDTAGLPAAPEVNLPQRNPDQRVELRLAGPSNGYHWTINGKLYDPPNDGIEVKPGQRVRFRFVNESKMFHPMHFHGHTAQVMGPSGPAARKDTVLVAPLATVEMDFDTNNPGKWINHCHNTYHLESGMATFLYYSQKAAQHR